MTEEGAASTEEPRAAACTLLAIKVIRPFRTLVQRAHRPSG